MLKIKSLMNLKNLSTVTTVAGIGLSLVSGEISKRQQMEEIRKTTKEEVANYFSEQKKK